MSRLSVELPTSLDTRLDTYIPWGSKGAIITEILWQLVEHADKDKGACIYELIKAANKRLAAASN